MSQLPVDAGARQRALAPEQSFICVAPAGSGKTELLTQRVLVLLARVQQPEEILAITFTRKAAAEMQHRVLGALRLAQAEQPTETHKQHTWQLAKAALQADATHGWNLLQSPHRLQVRTFDGLCASLVKALPLQAQMGAGVMLGDDPDRLFTLAANNVLAELESPGEPAEALAKLLLHLDNQSQRVVELLVALLKTRAAWLPLLLAGDGRIREHLEACLVQIRQTHIERLSNGIEASAAQRLLALADFAARHLPEGSENPIRHCQGLTALPDASDEGLQQWQGLAALLLSSSGTWRKRLTKNEGFPTKSDDTPAAELKTLKASLTALIDGFSADDALRHMLAEVALLPYPQYPEQQWQILQTLTLLLPRLVAHLQLVFAAEGQLDFTEISLRADRALGDEDAPTDLALRLDHRISHVLVDEFQDTSSNQMQLIQKLTAGWQPDDGRTLFCVGDAMQSIYAFRSANVGLFLRCLGMEGEQGSLGSLALERLHLCTNFRSDAGVVEWINTAFSNAFPKQVDLNLGAVPFSPAVAFNADCGPAVNVQGFVGDNTDGAEGRWLAAQIQGLLQQDANATVAILGRARSQLYAVLPALKASGIRYRAVDLDPLAAVPAVQDVWVLTRALLDTSDTVAWLSVLRAPWCGLRLDDLLVIREQAGINVLQQLQSTLKSAENGVNVVEQDVTSRIQLVLGVLVASLQERQRKPLVDWVKGAWLALGAAATLNTEQQNNVERFFDALAECDEAQLVQNPERLDALLNELYALPDPDAGSQVQVMTMHKSKGLEFDAVFLVGLAASSGKPDAPLMRWHEQLFDYQFVGEDTASTWLLSPVGEKGQDKDALYQWLGHQQKKREQLEACRLLYVACTRAKKQLYLSAVLKQSDKQMADGVLADPAQGSLLAHIWPSVQTAFTVRCQRHDLEDPQAQNINHAEPSPTQFDQNFSRRACEDVRAQLEQLPQRLSHYANNDPRPDNSTAVETGLADDSVAYGTPSPPAPKSSSDPQQPITSRVVGTLVHEVLELLVPAQFAQRPATQAGAWAQRETDWQHYYPVWCGRIEQLLAANVESTAFACRVPSDTVTAWCDAVAAQLDKAMAATSPLWSALESAVEVVAEYDVDSVNAEGEIRRGRIDLWWRSKEGGIYLLDYKTAVMAAKTTLAEFEQTQLQAYGADLAHYARVLSQILAQPVTPILYLIDSQSWLTLDVVDAE